MEVVKACEAALAVILQTLTQTNILHNECIIKTANLIERRPINKAKNRESGKRPNPRQ